MGQLSDAKRGVITDEMKACALDENLDAELIREGISKGNTIISQNIKHKYIKPLAIGKGLRTKINANIGTSKDHIDMNEELEKLRIAVNAGADTIMDLSTGGNLDEIRKEIIKKSTIPVGTVPIYQTAIETVQNKKTSIVNMTADDIFKVIERHAQDGVDFVTVHCGVTIESVGRLKKEGRLMDVVSRGGAFLVEWMAYNDKENPLFENFDRLLDIAQAFDLTLSLGDGLRPGALADATDRGQVQELVILGELTQRAWDRDVQIMIEGPGHVPINQIEANILLQKQLCHGAPFYVLGPLVTDIAPGYDHITSAIGGAIAASAGADFLCYVTPSEHLGLPTVEDVRQGVIASRIAAHAADIAKGVKGAIEKDHKMAVSRKQLDWKEQINLALDPERAKDLRERMEPEDSEVCTMCGEFCAIRASSRGLSE
ncbi:MAG: phosphomethylpyrimidine synthase ThiC [Thermodesulfobacteriota bacterium]|nr:phosphomethylpyrimidine synthase ThiC [Thermodesulfobacteriota bacterium]